MSAAARIEVTSFGGDRPRTSVWFITEADRELARRHADVLDRLVDDLLASTGCDAAEALVVLVEMAADAEAYEREAARRGPLAL